MGRFGVTSEIILPLWNGVGASSAQVLRQFRVRSRYKHNLDRWFERRNGDDALDRRTQHLTLHDRFAVDEESGELNESGAGRSIIEFDCGDWNFLGMYDRNRQCNQKECEQSSL